MNELDSDLFLTEADIPPMEPEPTLVNALTSTKPKRPKCGAVRNVCGTCRGCGLASDRIDQRTHFGHDARLYCAECCPACRGTA